MKVCNAWHKNLITISKQKESAMANNENEKNETKDTSGIEKTATGGKAPNIGAGPVQSEFIEDGGHGEAKQPKEHTGKDTEMGGATGGTSGLGDASEGNDNTSGV